MVWQEISSTFCETFFSIKNKLILNGQCSSWKFVLVFLIYAPAIYLMVFEYTLFADDTSLFSVVHDINTSANGLNED